uniref:Uncharacterized protein n=1 Tax=Leersia perrieri TaxID=77586 RepID=A0A0D9V2P9_9ORYZ
MILAVLGVEAVFMVADVLGVLLAADTHEERSTIVGVPCVCFTSLVFFTPLTFIVDIRGLNF